MMGEVDRLLKQYEAFVALPWARNLSGAERVWFVIYDQASERRLRHRLDDFHGATLRHGHGWVHEDLTDAFSAWLSEDEYRDATFAEPSLVDRHLPELEQAIVDRLCRRLEAADETTVVAVSGVASLFGFLHVSDLLSRITDVVRGRLLVFFPGELQGNNYRLLGARDGWNYLAVRITAHDPEAGGSREGGSE